MQFVQVGMLGALGALAIPVIIHLMFRHRARVVELGTLQFLKVVLRQNARRKKLRRWLLLAIRMACIALIALLFARPYLVATEPSAGERLVVVLLDRSASMGLRGSSRPIDRALAEARSILGRTGSGTQLEIGLFDRAVQPMGQPSDLRRAALEPTDSGTDYGAAMAWARDLLVRSRKRTRELHILTDLQRSGLDRGEPVDAAGGRRGPAPRSGPRIPEERRRDGHRDRARVPHGPGSRPRSPRRCSTPRRCPLARCPVRLHIEASGQKRDLERAVDLDGGATATVEFPLGELPEGLWRGHVEAATGDELPFDDRRFLALPVAPPSRVLLVDGNPGRVPYESATYFLQAALRLAPTGERYARSPFDPRTVDARRRRRPARPGEDRGRRAGGRGRPRRRRRAAAGPVRRATAAACSSSPAIASWPERPAGSRRPAWAWGRSSARRAATDLPWRLDRWETHHPVFQPFADPEHGDLRRPAFDTITRIEPDPNARVLALVPRRRAGAPGAGQGRGKVLWFASACDRSWSGWPRSRLYLPMVHQMLAYACGPDRGRPGPLGDRRRPAEIGHRRGRRPRPRGQPRPARVRHGPMHARKSSPAASASASPRPSRRVEPSDHTDTARAVGDARLRSDELWPWMAMTLIGLLLAESFLANRTAA